MQDFNYHTHTYRCGHADYNMTDEDYVKEYIRNGYKKMAFTDHVPHENNTDTRKGVRMTMEERIGYLEEINDLKKKYDGIIDIKSGFEVEYLPELEDEIKRRMDECDIIITGQHFTRSPEGDLKVFGKVPYDRDDFKRYTECLYNIASKHLTDIIAHPDFALMSQDSFTEVEAEMAHDIGKIAEETKVPLEINLNRIMHNTYLTKRSIWNHDPIEVQKTRLGNCKYPNRDFWKIISEYDVNVIYGLDVHFGGQISIHNELTELGNYIIGQETLDKLHFLDDVEIKR